MAAVLGIDTAWTGHEPSGVALLSQASDGWRCVALAPSYDSFLGLADGKAVSWAGMMKGSSPDPAALLRASEKLLGSGHVTVVTVDMPVSHESIVGRRAADSAISRAFGHAGCGTHSPNARRPGPISTALRDGFGACGYRLAAASRQVSPLPHLIEVYPHPALLTLLNERYRIPYKAGKSGAYWRGQSVTERLEKLCTAHTAILAALKGHIREIPLALPTAASAEGFAGLKRYEDALDALVCAWVGIQYLAGKARAYGDAAAAIWVPVP